MSNTIFIPRVGRIRLAQKFASSNYPQLDGTITFHLFSNSIVPDIDDVTEDYDDIVLYGYAPWELVGVIVEPVLDSQNNCTMYWPAKTITAGNTPSVPVLAQGLFVTDDFDDTLLWVQVFDAPVTWTSQGDFFTFTPQFSFGPQASPLALPVVTNVSPNKGPDFGGTTVTIVGANLADAEQVFFGPELAGIFGNTATQILTRSPAYHMGQVDIRVVTTAGASWLNEADEFNYQIATAAFAAAGHASGEATLTVTSNFAAGDGDASGIAHVVASNHFSGAGAARGLANLVASSVTLAESAAGSNVLVRVLTNFVTGAGNAAGHAVVSVPHNVMSSSDGDAMGRASLVASSLTRGAGTATATVTLIVHDPGTGAGMAQGRAAVRVATNFVTSEGAASGRATVIASESTGVDGDASGEATVTVTSNLVTGHGHASGEASLIASSIHAGVGSATGHATMIAKSLQAGEGAATGRASLIASSLRAGVGSATGRAAARVATNSKASAGHASGSGIATAPRYALNFNGSTQYVNIGNPAALQLTTALSVSCWLKVAAGGMNTGNNTIVSKINTTTTSWWIFGNSGQVFVLWANGSTSLQLSGGSVSNNTLYHVATTWDGTTGKIYLNGSLINSGSLASPLNNVGNIFVGAASLTAGGANQYFPGSVDAVRIYNVALTSTQVTEIYGSGSGDSVAGGASANLKGWWPFDEGTGTTAHDNTSGGNNGTTQNSPSWVSATVLG